MLQGIIEGDGASGDVPSAGTLCAKLNVLYFMSAEANVNTLTSVNDCIIK